MEVTQPTPFKEAWYHDFAPPIHSLDRHGDFAPPLLALGLAAGFFDVGTGGNGLQYNIAKRYGSHNLGDWLWVQTTGNGTQDTQDARLQSGGPAMLFQGDSVNAAGAGIVLWSHDTLIDIDVVQQVYPGGLIYFLDGQDDIGYTEGGMILRYTGGSDVIFYTTDGIGFPDSGDFLVYTSGTADDSTQTLGSIELHTDNFATGGTAGDIQLGAGGDTPGQIIITTRAVGSLASHVPGDVIVALEDTAAFSVEGGYGEAKAINFPQTGGGEINIKTADNTLVINDHLGSPLVTYTG